MDESALHHQRLKLLDLADLASDQKRKTKALEACHDHFNDLKAAYPKGIPIAKNPCVRFVWETPSGVSLIERQVRSVGAAAIAATPCKSETMAAKRERFLLQKKNENVH